MSDEALTISEIEGEILDRTSVQSLIRQHLGLDPTGQRVRPREAGIAEMMVDLFRSRSVSLSAAQLFRWHRMLFEKNKSIREIGRYRNGQEPMQIVSGALYEPKVHFEGPPSKKVKSEMARFIKWFNGTAPDKRAALPTLTRAGISHLYFESIHPFKDGNGRIGRAIAEMALAQNGSEPTLTGLAATILIKRKSYYEALAAANKCNEITPWLMWFAGTAIEAQRRTSSSVEFILDKIRLINELPDRLNPRQEKAILRMFREGPEGFKGGLSAAKYVSITRASPATTTRDLADLVSMRALIRTGEKRHARYFLNIGLRPVSPVVINRRGEIETSQKN
jgi:Fic family protein